MRDRACPDDPHLHQVHCRTAGLAARLRAKIVSMSTVALPSIQVPCLEISPPGYIAAAAVALLILSSGIWKISDPFGWARMVEEFLVPAQISQPLTLLLGVGATLGLAH